MALSYFAGSLVVIINTLTCPMEISSLRSEVYPFGLESLKDVILWFRKLLNGPLILNFGLMLAGFCVF